MDFRATPLNVVALLLIAFAVWVLYFLSKRKLDTNLPLVFFGAVFVFLRYSETEIHPYVFLGGAALALLVRFEFMNRFFTTLALGLEFIVISGIAAKFFADAFGLRF